MAQGDLDKTQGMLGIAAVVGAVATSDGVGWFLTAGFSQIVVHVEGITTGTVQLRGSNQTAQPAATDDELAIGEVTADGWLVSTALPKWMKVMVSAWTTGTFNAYALLKNHKEG